MKNSKIFIENGNSYKIIVNATLNYIKGNSAPYFSVTGEIWHANKKGEKDKRYFDCIAGGCLHDDIEKHFPGVYSDIINLHLSDINGLPMYAVENGFYWFQQDQEQGFDYIRLPKDKRNVSIKDKQDFINLVESLKPMYKQEADDCIKRHNLVVAGDKWEN